MKALTNIQINKLLYFCPNFAGCFSRDTVPKLECDKFYIVNMDLESGKGTHWVLIYNIDKSEIIYFDSFGSYPPQEILKRMLETKKQIIINDLGVQRLNSSSCGEFCIYVAKLLLKNESLPQILLNLNELELKKKFFSI